MQPPQHCATAEAHIEMTGAQRVHTLSHHLAAEVADALHELHRIDGAYLGAGGGCDGRNNWHHDGDRINRHIVAGVVSRC